MASPVRQFTNLVFRGALAVAAVVVAQGAAAQAPAQRNVFSVNPLGIPFEYFAVEYEHMASSLTSIGLTGSYLGIGSGSSYSTLEAKLRFYPNEEGPKGFAVGLAAGVTHVSENASGSGTSGGNSASRPTLGVIVDYNWILGKTKRFVVGAGLGAKRIFGVNGDDYADISGAYPTARFQLGIRY